jgi:hypothetical protein
MSRNTVVIGEGKTKIVKTNPNEERVMLVRKLDRKLEL